MADRMQDDAMQRYRQMYSKAQPEKSQNETVSHNKNDNSDKPPVAQKENVSLHKEQKPSKSKSDSVLDIFMKDKEKSLIILLIVILLSEKADTTLILALMYLVI
ncbi:MAG: hypothetical protein IJ275_05490 [Ruminococcus sp.]|nr:hypothetical protein [Ruminococcus sp.]